MDEKTNMIEQWITQNSQNMHSCPAMSDNLIQPRICDKIRARPHVKTSNQSDGDLLRPTGCDGCIHNKDAEEIIGFEWWKIRLIEFMEKHEIKTLDELSQHFKVNNWTIRNIMSHTSLPGIKNANKIAKALGCKISIDALKKKNNFGNIGIRSENEKRRIRKQNKRRTCIKSNGSCRYS